MILGLLVLAVHTAPFGGCEQICLAFWAALPCLGIGGSFLGSHDLPEYPALHTILNVFLNITKEQLCSNAFSTRGCSRIPPPYVDLPGVTVAYSNHIVAHPSIFPQLSVFWKPPSIDCETGDLQVQEDVHVRVHALMPADDDAVKLQNMSEWETLFPALDRLKRTRLLGRLGTRILGKPVSCIGRVCRVWRHIWGSFSKALCLVPTR